MAVVSTAPGSTRNTWMCPTCQHGSPDPRDELAHLDAHRQLGQFLREWDAAVVSDRRRQRGRRPMAVLAGVVMIVALVAGAVIWGVTRSAGGTHPVAEPVPALTTPAPAPAQVPEVGPAPQAQEAPPAAAEAPPPAPDMSQQTPATASPATRDAVAPSPAGDVAAAADPGTSSVSSGDVSPVPAPTPPPAVKSLVPGLASLLGQPQALVTLCVNESCLAI